jgi:AsmA protein
VLGTARTNGSFAVRLNGDRPAITANLKISHLDADQLTRMFRAAGYGGTSIFRPRPGMAAQRSVDELLRSSRAGGGIARFSPQHPAVTTARSWPTDPIDGAALHHIDVNAQLAVDNLKLGGLQFTRSDLHITLQDGALSADLKDGLLYGGRIRSRLTARPGPTGVIVALNCFAEGISAKTLLGDIAATRTIEGATRLAAKISGAGASQQEIMASLAGTAQVTLTQGAIAGWDASAVLAQLKRGRIPELRYAPSEKTEFRQLSATFGIDHGVANTRDLRLIAKVATVAGKGNIDIGRRQLDLLTTTTPIAGADDNQAQSAIAGLALPIRIRGDWTKPSVTLELENAFRNPDKARKALRKARRRFKGRDPNDIVRGILRDGKKSEDLRAAKKVLKDLFR